MANSSSTVKILGWGKCKIKIEAIAGSGATVVEGSDGFFPTPVEGSTSLSTTKGDKKEAKIEGGANEGVKYGRNSYMLEFNIRRVKGRTFPVTDLDGVVDGMFKVTVIPEDESAPGVQIKCGVVSTEDGFDTTEGGTIKFTVDSLIPEDGKSQLAWDTYSSTGAPTT